MKKICLSVLFLSFLFSISLVGQNSAAAKKYNIPPGSVLKPKSDQIIDYSYKLNELPNEEPKNPTYCDFLKDWTSEDLDIIKDKEPETFSYYMKAQAYYKSLSNKVKVTFTYDELWYIYKYDDQLKNRLTTIK